jgi:L-2-hydroxyglutarate oxidase LhgO
MPGKQDVLVVGGGIVGLATARALATERPGLRITVLEKEARVGSHQTGHNSGVLHSGLYYPPGSAKAQLCVEGRREMTAYCESRSIPVRVTGKLVVATRPSEVERLADLERRGVTNGLQGIERLGPRGIRDVEPHAVGLAALFVPETGVVDFSGVAASLAATPDFDVCTGRRVRAINAGPSAVEVITTVDRHEARLLVNCAGLHSDRVAALAGLQPDIHIVPFRGEYYALAPASAELIRSLIYPVPDPRFPFLGVHLTRTIGDVVEVGPNAVLAFGREHYRGAKLNWSEAVATLRLPGLRRLARRYWRPGLSEIVRSRSRKLYARSVRHLVPAITASDLLPGGSGVRAQAMTSHGRLIDDFVFMEGPRSLHVLNAPSPAATASLAIGRQIATRALATLDAR